MLLRKKLLTKNINEIIDEDEYWYGQNYIKDVYNVMSCIRTMNNEYTIYFDREESKYHSDYDYICSMSFVNRFNIQVARLEFSEVQAFEFVDDFYEFAYSDYSNTFFISIRATGDDLPTYMLTLTRQEDDTILFTLEKTSALYGTRNTILRFTFEDIGELEDMAYDMYFSYLIDIDDGETYMPSYTQNGLKYERFK